MAGGEEVTWIRDRSPLPQRAQRVISILREERDVLIDRFEGILLAIATAHDLERAHRLARVALEGLEPGTYGWSKTFDFMSENYKGICKECGYGVVQNGSPTSFESIKGGCNLSVFSEGCPAKFGAVDYVDTDTCVRAA